MPYSQFRIYGRHAVIMLKLSKNRRQKEGDENPYAFMLKGPDKKEQEVFLFSTNLQCYMVSAMLGELLGKKIEKDDLSDVNTKDVNASIFPDQLNSVKATNPLDRIYQHIVLSDPSSDADAKIKKAFSIDNVSYSDREKVITSYARAGLEYLDNAFKNCRTYDDFCKAMIDILDEVKEKQENLRVIFD